MHGASVRTHVPTDARCFRRYTIHVPTEALPFKSMSYFYLEPMQQHR